MSNVCRKQIKKSKKVQAAESRLCSEIITSRISNPDTRASLLSDKSVHVKKSGCRKGSNAVASLYQAGRCMQEARVMMFGCASKSRDEVKGPEACQKVEKKGGP
jgi:hypothetical protein